MPSLVFAEQVLPDTWPMDVLQKIIPSWVLFEQVLPSSVDLSVVVDVDAVQVVAGEVQSVTVAVELP